MLNDYFPLYDHDECTYFSHEFIRHVNTFYDRSLYYSLSVVRIRGKSIPNHVRWIWTFLHFFCFATTRYFHGVRVTSAHKGLSFDFRINGHLRSSLFWDVTQRRLVATDI